MFVLLECGESELASLGVKEGGGEAEGEEEGMEVYDADI